MWFLKTELRKQIDKYDRDKDILVEFAKSVHKPRMEDITLEDIKKGWLSLVEPMGSRYYRQKASKAIENFLKAYDRPFSVTEFEVKALIPEVAKFTDVKYNPPMEYTEKQKKQYGVRLRKCVDCDKEIEVATTGKRCATCYWNASKIKTNNGVKARKIAIEKGIEKKCLFCKSTEKMHIHHIDANNNNNEVKNLVYLCSPCHKKIHGKIYNQLYRRFFAILREQRFTMDEIGTMFSTTRQNVNQIIKA